MRVKPCSTIAQAAACLLLSALLLAPALARAGVGTFTVSKSRSGSWSISADRLAAQHDASIMEASGNVVLHQGESTLKADFARYYQDTGWVYLRGNVQALWGGDHMQAQEAEFDLRNMVGWLKDGRIFVEQPHLYFAGSYIEKLDGENYLFKQARVTACDEEPAAWAITADQGEITLDGYAFLTHTTLHVADQAAVYSPMLVLPAKTTRQSGLLTPDYGHSSRLGFYYDQPYYQVLDDSSDLTVYENFMSSRGVMHGLEYRNAPGLDSLGLWRVDWLKDLKKDDIERDENEAFQGDGLTRANTVRYWWRSKYDGRLADPRWKMKLDLDWVSDQNYLREFKAGKSGYEESRKEFLAKFRRDLAEKDSLTRTSTALAHTEDDKAGLAVRTDWTEDLRHRNGNRQSGDDPTAQRLPELNAYVFRDRLLSGPLEWSVDSGLAHFWSQAGDRGSRLDVRPMVSLPLANEYGGITASAGLRQTGYQIEHWGNSTASRQAGSDNYAGRTMPEMHLAAFTGFSKVFSLDHAPLQETEADLGKSHWSRIRHSVQPRLEYDISPYARQSNKPYFDEVDRLLPRDELTYSLTNLLDRREDLVSLSNVGNATVPRLGFNYLEFLRVRLEQSYDLREAGRNNGLNRYSRRPVSDALAETTVNPSKYLSLTQRTFYSPYLSRVTEHEHLARLEKDDWGSVLFGLDFLEDLDEYKRQARKRMRMVRTGAELYVSRRWSAGFDYRTDMVTDTDVEKTIYAAYKHQCFTLHLYFTKTPYEDRVEARIDLLGLSF